MRKFVYPTRPTKRLPVATIVWHCAGWRAEFGLISGKSPSPRGQFSFIDKNGDLVKYVSASFPELVARAAKLGYFTPVSLRAAEFAETMNVTLEYRAKSRLSREEIALSVASL